MKRILCGFFIVAILFFTEGKPLRVSITKGQIKPEPIAIVPFVNEGDLNLSKIIAEDLESSGLFDLVPKESYLQNAGDLLVSGPVFSKWKVNGTRFLVYAYVDRKENVVKVSFRLHDVISGKEMLALSVSGSAKTYRRLAHIVADEIFSRVTNEKGFFNTRVAFVDAIGRFKKGGISRIAIMDRDGYNMETLTHGPLDLTPRFSPNGKWLAFLSFKGNEAVQVYLMNLDTKRQELLGRFKGMTYAPRFSPDSSKVVFSYIDPNNGNNSICVMNLHTRSIKTLTDSKGIDTSPCFSNDGSKITFVSSRGGRAGASAKIFVMDVNGGNLHCISEGEGKYFQPVWSPRGDQIAFIKQLRGKFYLGVMKTDGSDERLIASAYLIESPVWAPNGRYLYFSREMGCNQKASISCIDLTGFNQYNLPTKGKDASHCDAVLIDTQE